MDEDMVFSAPDEYAKDLKAFEAFIEAELRPHLSQWYDEGAVPRSFFGEMAENEWLGFDANRRHFLEQSSLKQAILVESLSKLSPGVAVAFGAHTSLGTKSLLLFGNEKQKGTHLDSALRGDTLMCLGNTELIAGSDVANVGCQAEKVDGGWLLNGSKAYVTNGAISDMAVITAISDPEEDRNKRLSMFLVDLSVEGVSRRKLHKQVWIPSDLTRLQFRDVFVPDENLLGKRGRGLQQVLTIFTDSRILISAMALGTAAGAFELALDHAQKRQIFGKKIFKFQAKSFEIADFFTRIESARLMLWKACEKKDQGEDFRLESSMAKYLTVMMAREVALWAADLFGAASVIFEHPIHKFPMDAWAASLGEGTQDIQKLIIFREIIKKSGKERRVEV
ncbi:MAG: acyl-CoA dehydrogenase family protein [Desulfobacteraceae bacterium]|jgi:alkylation response protein AidB-like acyl-CoA dehydrogenase